MSTTSDVAERWVSREPALQPLAPAIRLREAGKHAEAAAWLRNWLEAHSADAGAHALLAQTLWQLKQDTAAAEALNRALHFAPDAPVAQRNFARALVRARRGEDALAAADRAAGLDPTHPETLLVRASALEATGQPDSALKAAGAALAGWPDYAEAHAYRAMLHRKLGDHAAALADAEAAVRHKPGLAAAWALIGHLHRQAGDFDAAAAAMEQASALEPDNVVHRVNLGEFLRRAGRFVEARKVLEAALALAPHSIEALQNLGVLATTGQRWEDAVELFTKLLALAPHLPQAYTGRALALLELRRDPSLVEADLQSALALAPDYDEALLVYAQLRTRTGELPEALALLDRLLAVRPNHSRALANRGQTLLEMGLTDQAEDWMRRALALDPENLEWNSILMFILGRRGAASSVITCQARRFGEVAARKAQSWVHRLPPSPFRAPSGRRLRIGYLSGDFRKHPVIFFAEPLFQHHDHSRVEVFAYHNNRLVEGPTERIRAAVDHWRPVCGMSDLELVRTIRNDEIDVLVELSGHTGHNRLGALAGRAAPIQAHYLGFFAPVGLQTLDYWIGDTILTPPSIDDEFPETVWRLPRLTVAYGAREDAPQPRRQTQPGVVRVGSFNALSKITPRTVELWSRVLQALPEARLLLKTKELLADASRASVVSAFEAHGIGPERLELHDESAIRDWGEHMDFYSRMDISLDPIGGQGGGTTTCDALWMGVPVVTLTADRVAGRATEAMLSAVGAADFVAETAEAYVAKVVELARDPARLERIRSEQRGRMRASPLCDPAGLACALEDAYAAWVERRFVQR